MKWVFLAALLLAILPFASWIRSNRRHEPKVWALLGFLPFVVAAWNFNVAPISWAAWPGYVKGVEVSLLEAVALALLIANNDRGPRQPIPFRFWMAAYFAVALLSVLQAGVPMGASFYPWQLLRVFLVYAAALQVARRENGPAALIAGMVLGLSVQAGYAIADRVAGAIQTGGGLRSQNLLGVMSHIVVFPAFALLLAGARSWAARMGPVSGVVTAILGASRATLGLAAIGYGLLVLLSFRRKMTRVKGRLAVALLAALAIAAPIALNSLERRYAFNPAEGSSVERESFKRAAWLIIGDNPLGIGPNQYVVVANTGGYSERAGVIWNTGSRATNVHNAYLLIAAETGFLGLICFLGLYLNCIITALRAGFRSRDNASGELLLGLSVALIIVGIHSLYEWVLLIWETQIMVALAMALIGGTAHARIRSRSTSSGSSKKGSIKIPRRPAAPTVSEP